MSEFFHGEEIAERNQCAASTFQGDSITPVDFENALSALGISEEKKPEFTLLGLVSDDA